MADISVIMPVYNSENYLEKTLSSLTGQTLEDIEIICINDGSTDSSAEILNKFSDKDNRIKVFDQNHAGAGGARNTGLSMASGEYVVFLDSDDFFDRTLLEKIVAKGRKIQADVLLFGAKRYDDRTGETTNAPRYLWRKLIPEQEVFSRRDMDGRLFGLTTPQPWTKAFRRDFILEQKILFQELPNSNDVRFVLTALAAAERIAVIREDLVYYRVFREGSLQNKKDEAPLCFLEAYRAVYDELNRRRLYAEVERGFCDMVLSGCVYNLNTIYSEKARWSIMRALCSDRFTDMGILNHPAKYYDMPEYFYRIAGIPFAVEVREEQDRLRAQERTVQYSAGEDKCGTENNILPGKIKISVVVAVYNMQWYLAECIDSILAQTLEELEVLCIDDGSTDQSLELLHSYARKDARVKVYHQQNAGLSAVRNRGVSLAAGEYIYFLDSDDMLVPEGLEVLYQKSAEKELDILYFNGEAFYESHALESGHPEFRDYYIRKGSYPEQCPGQEMFVRMRRTGEYRTNTGLQFFRREFLKMWGCCFCPGILHEDNDFTFITLLTAKRVGYTEGVYFRRRIRNDSIMTAGTSFAHSYGYFRGFLNMLSFVTRQGFPEEMTSVLYDTLRGVLDNAKSRYNELPEEEKYAYLGLEGMEQTLFRLFVEEEAIAHAGMKRAYREKSEINRILQKTYAEKSEINRKLQITYKEKYDRGVKIKQLERELEAIKESETYRLARMIGFPVRVIRKFIKKVKKST